MPKEPSKYYGHNLGHNKFFNLYGNFHYQFLVKTRPLILILKYHQVILVIGHLPYTECHNIREIL